MNLKRFFKECNNRGVFKTLSIYIVSSWVVLQVLSVVAEPLGLPEKSVTYLIIILLIGLPLYLLFLWKSKVRFAKSEQKDDVAENIQNEINFKRSYFISLGIISLFTIASVFFIINTNFTSGIKLLPSNESNKIAVMDFQNMTGVDSLNIVGEMAADWLSFGIAENEVGEVISSEVVSNYSNLLGVQLTPESSENILDRFFNPSKLVSGSYFLRDSTLIFNCRIMDGAGKTTLQAFAPVNCDMTSSLDCIENLKQEVITYLHTSQNKEVVQVLYEEDPPKFEAYKKVLQAEADYDDEDNYIKLINEAITIDSEYFYAKILKVQHHHNMGEYRLADSLIKT